MLSHQINRIGEQISVIDNYLLLCETCDKAVADPESQLHSVLSIHSILPSKLQQEKTFRHCAVVTQLYSIYEQFCKEVLEFWLTRLPDYTIFPNLKESFRNAYRNGIAKIISSNSDRYRNLDVTEVVKKLLISLEGKTPWEFVVYALTAHDRNLRREEFEKLFNSVDLSGAWGWIEKDLDVESLTLKSSSNRTLEQTIQDLVTYRNDASHGFPDEILGIDELREFAAFLIVFCKALAEFITHKILQQECLYKPGSILGKVTHTYSDNILIATCNGGEFRTGDKLYFFREKGYVLARIESLQVNKKNRSEVIVDKAGFELGICTSVAVPKNSTIVSVSRHF